MAAENLEMDSLKTLYVDYSFEIASPEDVPLNPKAPGHGGVCRAPLMGAFLESNSLHCSSCLHFRLQTGDAYTLPHRESLRRNQHDVCTAPSIWQTVFPESIIGLRRCLPVLTYLLSCFGG